MATTAAHIETRLSVAIHAVLHNASAHTSFTSNLACDFTASTARNEAAAGADRALARASSLPPTAHHRAPPHHWTPDELQQTLLSLVKSVDPTQRLPVHRGLEALGWASLPDPNRSVYTRVKSELRVLRCRVQHGEEPVAAGPATRRRNMAMTWAAWIRAAVAQMGDREAGQFTSTWTLANVFAISACSGRVRA